MEAHTRATDGARWRDAVDPAVEERLAAAIDELAQLPVLDATVMRVIAALDDPDSTTADLVGVLEADPTFAANLLRYANSAARSHPIRAKSIRQAVMLVGRRPLRQLALETATYRFLEVAPGNRETRGEMHLHALGVAGAAQAAATRLGVPPEAPHLGALLHDVGKLVLPLAFGEAPCADIARAHPDGIDRALAERDRLGVDHATAGALLAERWNLPDGVADVIGLHHGGPTGVMSPQPAVASVQLANELHRLLRGGVLDHALIDVALECCATDATFLDDLAPYALPADAVPPAEGTVAREIVEREHLSQTDDLTGAANRRHWLQATGAALADAGAGAVVLCSVGNLDAVDELHGPRVADTVLCEVARLLGQHGHAGRLGESRFGVWVAGGELAATVAAIDAELEESLSAGGLVATTRLAGAAAPRDGASLPELLEVARGRLAVEAIARRAAGPVDGVGFKLAPPAPAAPRAHAA